MQTWQEGDIHSPPPRTSSCLPTWRPSMLLLLHEEIGKGTQQLSIFTCCYSSIKGFKKPGLLTLVMISL